MAETLPRHVTAARTMSTATTPPSSAWPACASPATDLRGEGTCAERAGEGRRVGSAQGTRVGGMHACCTGVMRKKVTPNKARRGGTRPTYLQKEAGGGLCS